ncbi:unnamed protein product [Victoria cruziana]
MTAVPEGSGPASSDLRARPGPSSAQLLFGLSSAEPGSGWCEHLPTTPRRGSQTTAALLFHFFLLFHGPLFLQNRPPSCAPPSVDRGEAEGVAERSGLRSPSCFGTKEETMIGKQQLYMIVLCLVGLVILASFLHHHIIPSPSSGVAQNPRLRSRRRLAALQGSLMASAT